MSPRQFKNAPYIVALIAWSALGGCSAPDAGKGSGGEGATDSGAGADGAADGGAADGDSGGSTPPTLNGTRPDEALPAPDFTATNRDGAARDREDLLGGPTVMWFYPAATTAG
ncbi:MAG: hypothetical protein RL071_2176 [Pseudomonadota bacterium]|jgi:hypothetical protein